MSSNSSQKVDLRRIMPRYTQLSYFQLQKRSTEMEQSIGISNLRTCLLIERAMLVCQTSVLLSKACLSRSKLQRCSGEVAPTKSQKYFWGSHMIKQSICICMVLWRTRCSVALQPSHSIMMKRSTRIGSKSASLLSLTSSQSKSQETKDFQVQKERWF